MLYRVIIGLTIAMLATSARAECSMTNDGKTVCRGTVERVATTRHHKKTRTASRVRRQIVSDANGNTGIVKSRKTGATAHVSAKYAPQFQAYIDDLEAEGSSIRFIGGIRRGKCWPGGLHPCGRALDVCQLSRGRVDARCNLPGPQRIAEIARRHGLFEGGQWCHSDYGHAQVGVTAGVCGSRYAHGRRHRIAMRGKKHERNSIAGAI